MVKTSTAGDTGSTPGQGTKFPHAMGCSQKRKKKKKKKRNVDVMKSKDKLKRCGNRMQHGILDFILL